MQPAWQAMFLVVRPDRFKINRFMKLFEMFTPAIEGYQDVESDNSKPKWKESRKTKLTLRQIRKLRKMNDVRNYEKASYLKKIHAQYSQPAPDQPQI
jgi:hypothetical protein